MSDKLKIFSDNSVAKENSDKEKDDIFWVQETLKNNPEAFAKIMHKYYPLMERYIHRIAGSFSLEVDDLLQNTFIKVYQNLNDFDDSLSFSSWIYRITHNEVIDYIRKAKNRPRAFYSVEEEESAMNIADEEADSSIDAEKKIMRDRILQALSRINERHRSILILRYLEGKDYNEISDILKLPLGTVSTLIYRAKKDFKEIAERSNLNIKDI